MKHLQKQPKNVQPQKTFFKLFSVRKLGYAEMVLGPYIRQRV